MITVVLKVMPQSSKRQFSLTKEGELKCYLHSPPEGGRANAELVEFLAEQLGLPKRSITITRGLTSRRKTVAIEGFATPEEFYARLGLEAVAQKRFC